MSYSKEQSTLFIIKGGKNVRDEPDRFWGERKRDQRSDQQDEENKNMIQWLIGP